MIANNLTRDLIALLIGFLDGDSDSRITFQEWYVPYC